MLWPTTLLSFGPEARQFERIVPERASAREGTVSIRSSSAERETRPLDGIVILSLRRFSKTDMHSGPCCKGDKHFKAEPLPFASDQV